MPLERIDPAELDPARTVVVATGNAHKLVEIEAILGAALPGTRFVALGQLGDFPDPEETGTTFEENALIKACAGVDETGLTCCADDSGLQVDALGGNPGVLSARYCGRHGDDEANNAKLLANLAGVPAERRRARFVSVVALVRPGGGALTARGTCEGSIGETARGSNGFGYDPLFWPDATPGRTMAELSADEKNAISHRHEALVRLVERLG